MGVNGIYGLSGSGLDIESMVKVGMMGKQSQYDKMQQKYTQNEWKKTEYLSTYGTIQTFNNSTLSQYKMSNTMNARSADSSNESAVKTSANATAANMTHYVEVGRLASAAYLIGNAEGGVKSQNAGDKTSINLQDALFSSLGKSSNTYTDTDGSLVNYLKYTDANGNTADVKATDVAFSFSLSDGTKGEELKSTNENVVTVTTTGTDTSDHQVHINSVAKGASMSSTAVLVRYDGSGNVDSDSTSIQLKDLMFKKFQVSDDNNSIVSLETLNGRTNQNPVDLSKDAFSFTLSDNNDHSATISASFQQLVDGYTMEDLANEINNAGIGNISASFDATTGKFTLSSDEVGSSAGIKIHFAESGENGTTTIAGTTVAKFFKELGFVDDNTGNSMTNSFSSGTENSTKLNGTNAVGTVDGESVTFTANIYADTATGITYTATGAGDATTTFAEQKEISVTYQQLADGYSFNDLASAINSANTNVRASYDSVQDQFTIYNKESGADNKVSLTMANDQSGTNAANFFNNLALKSSANGELSDDALTFTAGDMTTQAGENAIVKIDGVDYTNLSSNKTTVNGVIYEFKDTTSGLTSDGKVDSANGTKVTVSVTQDADAIIDKVKSFVEDYNKLLADLYKKYDEKPNSNYKPLTESQKNAMTEEQVTKWEEKAKAGMLYHDKELGDLITKMRSAVSEKVEGISSKYDTIFALGISTTGVKGQLTLDEDKLRSALAEDPDAVYNVFAKLDKDDNYSGNGIAQRLGDVFTSSMKRIKSVSGSDTGISEDSDLNNLLRELQTKMSNFKKLMSSFEEQLYKKYDAMESSLSLLGTQLNYVTSSFS